MARLGHFRKGERPSSLTKHVTDDGSECCCGSLLYESHEGGGGAGAVLKRRECPGKSLRYGQSESNEI